MSLYSPVASGSNASNPVWLNDGRVAFTRDRDGTPSVVIASANGSGEETVLARSARYPSVPTSGSILVFNLRAEGSWRRWQVSTNGGGCVQWSPSGTELFFRGRGDDLTPALKSVTLRPGAENPFGPETTWFTWGNGWDAWYAVARDGRVLVSASAGQPDIASVRVIRNWFLEFPGK